MDQQREIPGTRKVLTAQSEPEFACRELVIEGLRTEFRSENSFRLQDKGLLCKTEMTEIFVKKAKIPKQTPVQPVEDMRDKNYIP